MQKLAQSPAMLGFNRLLSSPGATGYLSGHINNNTIYSAIASSKRLFSSSKLLSVNASPILSSSLSTSSSSSSSSSTTLNSNVTNPLKYHNHPLSAAPLMENYHSQWPHPSDSNRTDGPNNRITPNPPPRTVSPDALKFKLTSSFEHGTSILYPHLEFNPADFKVTMYVSIDDLGLTAEEKLIFIEMIGSRYNQGKREVCLTAERFPNRIENKRYLVVLLENLIAETKRLYSQSAKYQ